MQCHAMYSGAIHWLTWGHVQLHCFVLLLLTLLLPLLACMPACLLADFQREAIPDPFFHPPPFFMRGLSEKVVDDS